MTNLLKWPIALSGALLLSPPHAQSLPSGDFAITHVRVFDGEHTSEDQSVVVQDGRIVAVGKDVALPGGTKLIDGAGRTLLPGLIDAHVHAYPTNALREAEALGVTTVLDMFNRPELVRRDKESESTGAGWQRADIYSAGTAATAPHGHGTEYGFEIPTLTSPDEAPSWVDARIAEGSDYIKIILEDGSGIGRRIPTLDRPTINALVAAAHQRHKLAVFHIGSYQGAREAIEAGADGLMHLFVDKNPDPGFGEFVAAHHVFVVPTLSVLMSVSGENKEGQSLAADPRITDYLSRNDIQSLTRSFAKLAGITNTRYDVTTETIRQLKAAHVTILAGTDAPNPGTMFGASLHGELELLVQAGLTPEEALSAATAKPAVCFHLTDRGTIAVGKRADLLLVQGNPTATITDTRNIVAVWKSGHADDRAAYAAEIVREKQSIDGNSLTVGDGTISGFEDGTLHTAFGAGWSKSTDALYGGKSTAEMGVVLGGANGTGKSLRINGNIDGGLPFAWGGAMFSPGLRTFAPANLSANSGLKFWAKGDGKTYRVMVFTEAGGQIGQVTTFVGGADWKQYTLPFSSFGTDGHDVEAILFIGGPEAGPFDFQIDEVGLRGK